MFKLSYKLTVRERVQGKCNRHPRYNPEKDGRGGSKAAAQAVSPYSTFINPAWL